MEYVPPYGAAEPDEPYVDDDQALEVDGSIPPAKLFNDVQAEILAVIIAAGLAPSGADLDQLHEAIVTLRAAQTLGQHADVTITAPADGDGLVYQGGAWINGALSTEDPVARKRIALLALFRAMDENKARYGLVDDAYDGFETAGGIDAAASANETWNAAGYVTNKEGLAVRTDGTAIGTMTGGGGLAAGLDGSTATSAETPTTAGTGTIGWQWPAARNVSEVRVDPLNGSSFSPGGATENATIALRGSNDGSNWTQLASTTISDNGQGVTLTYAGGVSYSYHDVTVSGGGDRVKRVGNAAFKSEGAAQALSLIMNAVEAVAEPEGSHGLLLLEDVDGATPVLDTDVELFLSKDDGATWEAAALAQDGVTAEGYLILSGSIAAMAAAGDKTMRVKIETSDRAEWRLHGVSHQW